MMLPEFSACFLGNNSCISLRIFMNHAIQWYDFFCACQ
ncbi:hypothetical protein KIS1582_0686 [Cytobacillus firmus]|uniref:Uncharacterized protein n=1 Tax=Cytobacillus firmus TaxID=1399 RepID=A0A800NFE9_CYTFI|nr:hypothetical protein KIS1582_0686 [Cytobacillus firmus]